jgi:hypothetical protein
VPVPRVAVVSIRAFDRKSYTCWWPFSGTNYSSKETTKRRFITERPAAVYRIPFLYTFVSFWFRRVLSPRLGLFFMRPSLPEEEGETRFFASSEIQFPRALSDMRLPSEFNKLLMKPRTISSTEFLSSVLKRIDDIRFLRILFFLPKLTITG